MLDKTSKVLYSREDLRSVVERLGKQISEDYRDKNLPMVSILKGSVVFHGGPNVAVLPFRHGLTLCLCLVMVLA